MSQPAGSNAPIDDLLAARFGDAAPTGTAPESESVWRTLAAHRSQRAYRDDPVPRELVDRLCTLALCSPTKSDLQQRDIVVIRDPDLRGRIDALFPEAPWIATAPAFLVFCGNNRRQRQVHEERGRPFVNDHLDAFFNAAVDAGIALASFVLAAESVGLGCCPISAVRNHADTISDWLALPDWVFPVAGLTLGWPSGEGEISQRLPLAVTLHEDRFGEDELAARIEAYDARRQAAQPYARQRFVADYGEVEAYGWSEDKARQYSKPERRDFGAFVRAKGFKLD